MLIQALIFDQLFLLNQVEERASIPNSSPILQQLYRLLTMPNVDESCLIQYAFLRCKRPRRWFLSSVHTILT